MSCMIDRWHDAYHAEEPDYLNCPYCQDELMLNQAMPLPQVDITAEIEWGVWLEETYDPDSSPIDRLEELEI